jgi:hypothetical protein
LVVLFLPQTENVGVPSYNITLFSISTQANFLARFLPIE